MNCPSEFNGGVVSRAVVTADIMAIVFIVLAIAANIAEDYFTKNPILMDIFSYKRFFNYIAFMSLLYSFFMNILAEYSLIGTILYPIVSGTVGDPVDSVLSNSYFANLIGTLVAVILTSTVALIQRSRFYKAQKVEDHSLMKNKAVTD
ncbi:MAG: hypothetical protein JXC31_03660 [Acholeplasmataceae bacterium]|nr:hypothetical protein [Acholeplasmataceae bacterium]